MKFDLQMIKEIFNELDETTIEKIKSSVDKNKLQELLWDTIDKAKEKMTPEEQRKLAEILNNIFLKGKIL